MSISLNEIKSSDPPSLVVSEINDIGNLSVDLPTRSTNFGPGADLLMNSKKISKSPSSNNIQLDELKTLEISSEQIKMKQINISNDTINLN